LYYEGTVEDISERKRAEEALLIANEQLEIRVEERTAELLQSNQRLVIEIAERQRVEAELRALFAAMTDVIAVFDAQGRYLKMVTTNSALLYKPTTERIGKTVFEILPARQANLFFSNIQRALNTGQTVSLEYSLPISERKQDWSEAEDTIPEEHERILNPKWNEVWFSANVSPMPGNCVIWVARNITGRKLAEAALRQAEEKYRSIFENAAEGIFQTTFNGRYLSVNPALARMYGYSDAEEMMTHLTDVEQQLYVHPNRRTQFIAALEEHGAVSNFEAQVYRKDGTIIWTSQNARTVRDTQGRLLYYEGTVADITQRKFAEEALRVEQQKSERLLLNILPESIAERLKQDQHSIADRFEEVTILFADIVDFTKLAAQISATKLVNLLNEIFCTFDQITLAYGLEKIKTIGDSYMVVGGLPTLRSDHAEAIAEMALAMQQEIAYFQRDDGEPFHIRIGIHTGPVVAGVIGMKKFAYDLWGDTVNVASRMESQGMPGKIQVTKATYERLKDKYSFERRGAIAVKGKGEMITYWLTGRKVCHLRDGNSAQLY
jgi:PAS domain S-box-containing protein